MSKAEISYLNVFKEAKMFMNAKNIDSTKKTWLDLYKMTQEKNNMLINIVELNFIFVGREQCYLSIMND